VGKKFAENNNLNLRINTIGYSIAMEAGSISYPSTM